jgi:predicted nucleic acid-binding protein
MSRETPPPDSAEVAAALESLRAEVRARRQQIAANNEQHATYSALERELQRCAEQLEITRVVSAHWPLESRGLPQRAINLVNKVVRRLLRWYINPIVEQQNAFNDTAARTLRLLIDAYRDLLHQADSDGMPTPPAAPPAAPPSAAPPASEPRDPPPDAAALQARIAEQGRREPPAAFPDIALQREPPQLALRQQVNAHWLLTGNTPLTRATALLQKSIRFYLRWLINPIVEQQNTFHAALTRTVTPLLRVDAEVRALLAARRARRRADDGSQH